VGHLEHWCETYRSWHTRVALNHDSIGRDLKPVHRNGLHARQGHVVAVISFVQALWLLRRGTQLAARVCRFSVSYGAVEKAKSLGVASGEERLEKKFETSESIHTDSIAGGLSDFGYSANQNISRARARRHIWRRGSSNEGKQPITNLASRAEDNYFSVAQLLR
jgi:hypothetical protein